MLVLFKMTHNVHGSGHEGDADAVRVVHELLHLLLVELEVPFVRLVRRTPRVWSVVRLGQHLLSETAFAVLLLKLGAAGSGFLYVIQA